MISTNFLLFAIAVLSQEREYLLPASRIAVALTLFRFDDRCSGNEDCPMINIYLVEVRNPRCVFFPERDHAKHFKKDTQALNCVFESRVRTSTRILGDWRPDEAVLVVTPGGNGRSGAMKTAEVDLSTYPALPSMSAIAARLRHSCNLGCVA